MSAFSLAGKNIFAFIETRLGMFGQKITFHIISGLVELLMCVLQSPKHNDILRVGGQKSPKQNASKA